MVYISVLVLISVLGCANTQLVINDNSRTTFDNDLYHRVLDREQCERQMQYIRRNATTLYLRFLDSGYRVPRRLDMPRWTDLGDYYQCLGINEHVQDMTIEGKYCLLRIPFNQNFQLPFEIEDFFSQFDFGNKKLFSFKRVLISNVQKFGGGELSKSENIIEDLEMNLAVCIPKVCTSQDWFGYNIFNVSTIGFHYEDSFCRLPNDKPWVAADYVAIGIFSLIAFLTAISTLYDINYKLIQKKDPKHANSYYRIFSVYSNTKRLFKVVPKENTLGCLDGLRGISMLWVILGHIFSRTTFLVNAIDAILVMAYFGKCSFDYDKPICSGYVFDDDRPIARLYFCGKMTNTSFIKRLHIFYLHRLLRLFPLLAALVLLEASVFHRMVDGPYWVDVADKVQRCRTFWWSTLLHIQNYVNPDHICIQHSWYIAIDVQLHIVSPLILFWVLGKNRKVAWTALFTGLISILVASTVWNLIKKMPSSNMSIVRLHERAYYMNNYYMNALTRAAPFLVGMIVGYVLVIYKGKKIKLNIGFVLTSWIIALGLIASCFYISYVIVQLDWDNQIGDSLFNSFMRFVWSLGVGWIIFACAKGYGGPFNWFLSHPVWRLPARISYAIYLYHYPLMFVVEGMQTSPQYFSPGARIYDFMAFLVISLWVGFLMTIVIDAPFSTIIKLALEGGKFSQHTFSQMKKYYGVFLEGSKINQILCAVLINLPVFACGASIGWISPMSLLLQSEKTPRRVPLTDIEVSWITAIPYLTCIPSIYLVAFLGDIFGKKVTSLFISSTGAASWILMLSSYEVWAFILARSLIGITMSGCCVTCPIYTKEISDDNIRGTLSGLVILFHATGNLFVYIIGDLLNYRTIIWICLSLPTFHLIFFMMMPESPYYLVKSGDIEEAERVVAWLRCQSEDDVTVKTELESIKKEQRNDVRNNCLQLKNILKDDLLSKAFYIALLIMLTRETCGAIPVLNFAGEIFTLASKDSNIALRPNQEAILLGVVQVIGSVFALSIVEKAKRKLILLMSSIVYGLSMCALASWFVAKEYDVTSPDWFPIVTLCICIFCDSSGLQPITVLITKDMFSYKHRDAVLAIALSVARFFEFLQLVLFKPLIKASGLYTAFYLFGIICIFMALLLSIVIPETKGKSLVEIYKSLRGTKS